MNDGNTVKISRCPRCRCTRNWAVRREKRRCCACRYEWRVDRLPLYLNKLEWNNLLKRFLGGQSAVDIALDLHLGRERVLRALKLVRESMLAEMQQVFHDIPAKNPIYPYKFGSPPEDRSFGDTKQVCRAVNQPVFGLSIRENYVWAEIIPDIEAEIFLSMPDKDKLFRIPSCSYLPSRYPAIATREHFQHLASSEQWKSLHTQTNELEHFWRYLKGMFKLRIRKGYLPLYLAEYIWRYNHRHLSPHDQVKSVLSLLRARYKFSG